MIYRNPQTVLGHIGWVFSATLDVGAIKGEGEMLLKGRDAF